jgi:hypothetical protein
MLNAILSKAILQSLGKCIDLALGLAKRITIVMTVLLAFLRLDEAVTSRQNAFASCASLYPLTPGECLVCAQLGGAL